MMFTDAMILATWGHASTTNIRGWYAIRVFFSLLVAEEPLVAHIDRVVGRPLRYRVGAE